MKKVVVIEGDGIGKEVIPVARSAVQAVADLEIIEADMGMDCHRRCGEYLPDETVRVLEESDACLFGAITTPMDVGDYRSPLLRLRKHFDLYVNLRPARRLHPLIGLVGLDIVLFRENTEGMYTGLERPVVGGAVLERMVTERACRRLISFAREWAEANGRGKITCVHKANVLRISDGLFRRVFFEEMASSRIEHGEKLVDAAAAALIMDPKGLDCVVTLNMYGDILSDEAAALVGGLGMAPSANLGDGFGIFEPCHGSSPDIAGKGVANPVAALLSAAMMLDFLSQREVGDRIREAVSECLSAGIRTPDIGGRHTTRTFGEAVLSRLS